MSTPRSDPTRGWHAPPELIERYLTQAVDPAGAASLEAHLLECGRCRQTLADAAAMAPSGAATAAAFDPRTWAGIIDVLDQPRRGYVERAMAALGVPGHVARLVAATPALRWSWLAAIAAVLGFVVLVAETTSGAGPEVTFLVLAPLVPLAGIAVAYGPGADPLSEIAAAAPFPAFRLFCLRAAAVLVTSLTLLALAAPFVDAGILAAAWVLPALAVVSVAMALATWLPAPSAAAAAGLTWLVTVATVTGATLRMTSATRLDAVLGTFAPPGQLVAVTVLLVALFVLVRRAPGLELAPSTNFSEVS